jgi:hypothetical protein
VVVRKVFGFDLVPPMIIRASPVANLPMSIKGKSMPKGVATIRRVEVVDGKYR